MILYMNISLYAFLTNPQRNNKQLVLSESFCQTRQIMYFVGILYRKIDKTDGFVLIKII